MSWHPGRPLLFCRSVGASPSRGRVAPCRPREQQSADSGHPALSRIRQGHRHLRVGILPSTWHRLRDVSRPLSRCLGNSRIETTAIPRKPQVTSQRIQQRPPQATLRRPSVDSHRAIRAIRRSFFRRMRLKWRRQRIAAPMPPRRNRRLQRKMTLSATKREDPGTCPGEREPKHRRIDIPSASGRAPGGAPTRHVAKPGRPRDASSAASHPASGEGREADPGTGPAYSCAARSLPSR